MGNCCLQEEGLDDVVEGIDIKNFDSIKKQSQKCLCQIILNNNEIGTGFFCLIPFPQKTNLFQVLMTNNHVLGENDIINGKSVKFTINNDEKEINILVDNSRLVYTNKIFDITIIEIKKNEIEYIDFLDIDDQLYTENPIKYFKGRSIYIIQYCNENKTKFAPGEIKNMGLDNYSIEHKCQTEPGSSGSPIIDLKTYRVIGIHKGSNKNNQNLKLGTFLKEPIEEFRKIFIKKINDNNIDNEIIIKYKRNIYPNDFSIAFGLYYQHTETLSKDKLFGEHFVETNKNKCKIIIGNYEYDLKSYLNNENNEVKANEFEIKLKILSNITDISYMFCGCLSFYSIPNLSKLNTKNITNISFMFGCCSLSNIPDISNWDTINVLNMESLFIFCNNIISLPDLSNWKTDNVTHINGMFAMCKSLKTLPDISKWNTKNVKYMNGLFGECNSLISIPDISKWNTKNVINMKGLFYGCNSLKELPDIYKWDTSNVTNMSEMFGKCSSLESVQEISSWNTSKVINMSSMFYDCKSLIAIDDISIWNTCNVEDMSYMFYGCQSLEYLPEIEKWNSSKVKNVKSMFYGCNQNLNIPVKFKNNNNDNNNDCCIF